MNPRDTTTAWRGRTLLSLLALLAALAAVEVGFRAAGYCRPLSAEDVVLRWEPEHPYQAHEDTDLQVVLAPSKATTLAYRNAADGTEVHRMELRTNTLGLRGPNLNPTPAPGTLRILLLGDSVVMGQGVKEEQALPAALQRRLPSTALVEVINGGVSSWNLNQQTRWLELYGSDLQPDLVVQAFYFNDLDPIFVPMLTGAPPVTSNDSLMPPWARRESGLRRNSYLINGVLRALEQQRRIEEIRNWSPTPPQRGQGFAAFLEANWSDQAAREAFGRLARSCQTLGLPCAVAILPIFEPSDPDHIAGLHDAAAAAASASGLPVLRLDSSVLELSFFERTVHPIDSHPSSQAHGLMADALAAQLQPWLDGEELSR